jgi:hypothetical protein
MLLKTILNRCQKFKCFVYSEVKFTDHQGSACIEAWIEPRFFGSTATTKPVFRGGSIEENVTTHPACCCLRGGISKLC